jgi:hypothetical protein
MNSEPGSEAALISAAIRGADGLEARWAVIDRMGSGMPPSGISPRAECRRRARPQTRCGVRDDPPTPAARTL